MTLEWLGNAIDPKHVVVIDDDLDFLEMVRDVLEAQRYEVTTAYSFKELGDLGALGDVDAFLLDVFINPKPSGPEIALALRKAGFECPMCLLTGHSVSLEEEKQLTGITYELSLLQKPVSAESLLHKVAQMT